MSKIRPNDFGQTKVNLNVLRINNVESGNHYKNSAVPKSQTSREIQ